MGLLIGISKDYGYCVIVGEHRKVYCRVRSDEQ